RATMIATLAAANSPQPISTPCLRSHEPISDIADRLDHLGPQLRPQPPDAHVDDVAPGVEREPPDLSQQLLPPTDRASAEHEVLQQQELALGKPDRPLSPIGHPAKHVQSNATGLDHPRDGRGGWLAQAG